jgi:hypothetical protein
MSYTAKLGVADSRPGNVSLGTPGGPSTYSVTISETLTFTDSVRIDLFPTSDLLVFSDTMTRRVVANFPITETVIFTDIASAYAQSAIFADDFNRADSSLGGVGNAWRDPTSSWRITSGEAIAPTSGFSTKFLARPISETQTRCRVKAKVSHPGGNSVVLWALCDISAANGYGAWIGSNNLAAGPFTSGSASVLQTPVTLPNTYYDLEVTYNSGYIVAALYEVGGTTPIYRVANYSVLYSSGTPAASSLTNGNALDNFQIDTDAAEYLYIPDGDSITAGSGGVQFGWPPYAVGSLGLKFSVAPNLGVGGQQIAHILNGGGPGSRGNFDTDVVPRITSATLPVIYCMAAVTNDFYANRTVAAVLADITTMYNKANAAGVAWFCVVKCLYRADFPGSSSITEAAHRALVDAYNAQIDAHMASLGNNTLVIDWPGYTGMTDPRDTTYFKDLVHPTVLGAAKLGDASAATLITALPATYDETWFDTLPLSDVTSATRRTAQIITESITLSDSTSELAAFRPTIPDAFSFAEVLVTVVSTLGSGVSIDTFGFSDGFSATLYRTLSGIFTDTLVFTDAAMGLAQTGAPTVETLTESIGFVEGTITEVISEHPTYGTVQEADRYFGVLLHGELWERTTPIRKYKALVSATKTIDTLRFAGRKTDDDQALEFPRYGQTSVPLAIRQAAYEEALSLLKGVDPTTEYDNLFVRSRGFGSLRTDYEPQNPPEHKKAGVTSLRAWQMLLPHLKPALDLKLRRES